MCSKNVCVSSLEYGIIISDMLWNFSAPCELYVTSVKLYKQPYLTLQSESIMSETDLDTAADNRIFQDDAIFGSRLLPHKSDLIGSRVGVIQ